jgi:hypothetical protein
MYIKCSHLWNVTCMQGKNRDGSKKSCPFKVSVQDSLSPVKNREDQILNFSISKSVTISVKYCSIPTDCALLI